MVTVRKFGQTDKDVANERAKAKATNAKLAAEATKTKATNVKANAAAEAARNKPAPKAKPKPTSLFGRADAMSPAARAEYKRSTGE